MAQEASQAKESQLKRLIEDTNEYLYFIQDVYEVVEAYDPYHKMLTAGLLRIFYLPFVLQSLCVLTLKPKIQIQACLYILTQSFVILKHRPLLEQLALLTMGKQIRQSDADYLH